MTNGRSAMELAWASGLFEGEGSFSHTEKIKTPRSTYRAIRTAMSMTDLDALERFQAALKIGRITGPHHRSGELKVLRKPTWTWSTSGFEKVQACISMLWSGLGVRRRKRATELLKWARTSFYDHSRCHRGHLYDADNTYIYPGGRRACRSCIRIGYRARHPEVRSVCT